MLERVFYEPNGLNHSNTQMPIKMTHFKQITVVVHHEQNHQVHLSFGESPAVDDGARERSFHSHSVLNLKDAFGG